MKQITLSGDRSLDQFRDHAKTATGNGINVSSSGRESTKSKLTPKKPKYAPITGHRVAREGKSVMAELPMSDIIFNSETRDELQAIIRVQQDMIRAQGRAIATHKKQSFEHTKSIKKLKDFVKTVCHEVRLKLTLLIGPLALLSEINANSNNPAKFAGFLHMSLANAREASDMFQSIMASFKNGFVLNKKKLDVGKLVEGVGKISKLNQTMGNKRVIEVETVEAFVNGDKIHLERLLLNLVSNAKKFTKPAGVIKLSVKTDSDFAYVSVSDNGMGIPKDERKKIFEKYQTGNSNIGIGLGLSVVEEITKLHGGDVTVDSEEGKGSTFTVRLPLEKN